MGSGESCAGLYQEMVKETELEQTSAYRFRYLEDAIGIMVYGVRDIRSDVMG